MALQTVIGQIEQLRITIPADNSAERAMVLMPPGVEDTDEVFLENLRDNVCA